MKITTIDASLKREIFEASRQTMREWYGEEMAQRGACLYWTQVTMRELAGRGFRPVLQAGDMLWRIVPDDKDDGQRATHFGYEWSPQEPFSQEALANGQLPEVHVWVGLPDSGDLIDFATAYLPEIARRDHGYAWGTAAPPEYIFGRPPEGAFYRPHLAAIRFVWGFILEKMGQPQTETATTTVND